MEESKETHQELFIRQVGEKEDRKLKVQGGTKRSVWSGLGMFGMVGWSVAVPTLSGAALGIWLDKNYPQSFSWTLSLLISGLLLGCAIAGHWIVKEHNEMNQK